MGVLDLRDVARNNAPLVCLSSAFLYIKKQNMVTKKPYGLFETDKKKVFLIFKNPPICTEKIPKFKSPLAKRV